MKQKNSEVVKKYLKTDYTANIYMGNTTKSMLFQHSINAGSQQMYKVQLNCYSKYKFLLLNLATFYSTKYHFSIVWKQKVAKFTSKTYILSSGFIAIFLQVKTCIQSSGFITLYTSNDYQHFLSTKNTLKVHGKKNTTKSCVFYNQYICSAAPNDFAMRT